MLESGSSISNVVVKALEDVTPATASVKVTVENNASANLVLSEVADVSASVEGNGKDSVAKIDDITGKAAAIGNKTYATLAEAWGELSDNCTITLLNNCNTDSILSVPEGLNITVNLNNHNIGSTARVFGINKANSTLIIEGEGKITTSELVVFQLVGSSTDDGNAYVLKVGHNVEMASEAYGIAVFENTNNASYGIKATFEGIDRSKWGTVYVNGTVKKKVGNVPSITLKNAISYSNPYLGGFSKFEAINCVFNVNDSLVIKSGEVMLKNNIFNIDCSSMNKQCADYVSNGNGSFAGKCGLLFINGQGGYAGLTSVNVFEDNAFNFANTNGVNYTDAMYIDYTQDTSFNINIKVKYLQISDFTAKIAYSGKMNNSEKTDCTGYVYFVDKSKADSYTKEQFAEQYDVTVKTFGAVEAN